MSRTLFLFAGLLAFAAAAPAPELLYKDLTPGPYLIKVKGMLTHACARAIEEELARHPMISKAEADFEGEKAMFTVKPDGKLSFADLKAVLKKAAKRMRLSRYEITDIRYMPSWK